MISVNSLTKYYGELLAVDNISFTIRKGEITGLLGPNGAGKTTTLRMLTCYLKPSRGRISIGDFMVDENPMEIRNIIGYLPESAPIYSDMLVFDYLKYIGQIRQIEDRKRIKEISRICGLDEVMHQNVGELSKGYRQRVGLAHAMIHNPEILILDEPTSGLDPNQIVEIRNIIKEIGKEKTVILSTHILSEVEATCDRVIIINKGKIVADGMTTELISSFGNDVKISLKISGTDFNTLSEEIKKIEGIQKITQTENNENLTSAVVMATSEKDNRPEIFRLVTEKEWILYEMSREENSLENVFREITVGGGND